MTVIKGKVQTSDIIAISCNTIMLICFLWTHFVLKFDMLFAIVPLSVLEIYLYFFCLLPNEYTFASKGLEIKHQFQKTQVILYSSMYDYETKAQDGFINITENNEVKLYYQVNKKYKMIKCNPSDVEMFVSMLKKKCDAFHVETKEKTQLDYIICLMTN